MYSYAMAYDFLVAHPSEHEAAGRPLGAEEARDLAETLGALASPARLRLLVALTGGELAVEQLAAQAELSQSATSHNLRILRSLRLVRARRSGRNVFYSLHDHHLADLLAAIRHHHEHLHPPGPEPLPQLVAEPEPLPHVAAEPGPVSHGGTHRAAQPGASRAGGSR